MLVIAPTPEEAHSPAVQCTYTTADLMFFYELSGQ